MRGPDFALKTAEHLLKMRNQRLHPTVIQPIEIDCESYSTNQPNLYDSFSNSRMFTNSSDHIQEQKIFVLQEEDCSSVSGENMDLEDKYMPPSKSILHRQATEVSLTVEPKECNEEVKVQQEQQLSFKESMMKEIDSKVCQIEGNRMRQSQNSYSQRHLQIAKKIKQCLNIPDKEGQVKKKEEEEYEIIEISDEKPDFNAKNCQKKKENVNFRVTRNFVRETKNIMEEQGPKHFDKDELERINAAEYRYNNREILTKIHILSSHLTTKSNIPRKKSAQVAKYPYFISNSVACNRMVESLRRQLRRRQIIQIE